MEVFVAIDYFILLHKQFKHRNSFYFMIKGLLFDAVGTLIKMQPKISETIYESLQKYNVTEEEFSRAYIKAREFYYNIYEKNFSFGNFREFWSAFIQIVVKDLGIERNIGEKIYDKIIEKTKFVRYPESLEVLDTLSKNYVLGVISNWDIEIGIYDVFEDLEMKKYLSVILASKDIKILKPSPRIFLEALRRINLAPYQCFYIGDDPYEDFYGAKNVGLIPILIDRKEKYKELDCPRIKNLKGIYPYLEKNKFL